MTRPLHRRGRSMLATTGLLSRARERPDVGPLARPGGPPSARAVLAELGSGLAAARFTGALPRLLAAPRGDGHVVVDIPGWKAPELSGAPMRAYLRALGYDARGWGFGTNTGDPRRDVERITRRVLELVDASGSGVSLVGWSLGGVIAREVARRRPEAVRRVITYGTPVVGGPRFTAVARAYGPGTSLAAGTVGERLDAESPIRVPLTVVFTRRDGIVAWEACVDRSSPDVEHVEVFSTHIGMGLDPDVWGLVANRLAGGMPASPGRPVEADSRQVDRSGPSADEPAPRAARDDPEGPGFLRPGLVLTNAQPGRRHSALGRAAGGSPDRAEIRPGTGRMVLGANRVGVDAIAPAPNLAWLPWTSPGRTHAGRSATEQIGFCGRPRSSVTDGASLVWASGTSAPWSATRVAPF